MESQTSKPLAAVRNFLNKDNDNPVTLPEFRAFWADCSEDQRKEYSKAAAKELGVILEAA